MFTKQVIELITYIYIIRHLISAAAGLIFCYTG